jgi:uncharacterized protein (TIGR03067 family)
MLIMASFLFAVVGVVGVAITDDQAAEFKKLNGTWKIEQAELNGTKWPDALTQQFTLVLENEKYQLLSKSPTDEGTAKLDASKKPKTMEIKGVKGPNQGKTFLAIYEVDKDTLKICYDLSGKAYPTEFTSPANSGRFLVTYKRSKE